MRTKPDEDGITVSQAFNRISASWLGYELDENAFVDGAGDHGIDYWFSHSAGFDIIQTKMHDLSESGEINHRRFDNSGVNDLRRIRSFLLDDSDLDFSNKKLLELKKRWDFELSGRRTEKNSDPLVVNLILLTLGDGLTQQAQDELDEFYRATKNEDLLSSVPIQFRPALLTLETLIDSRWREQNREWRDKDGNKRKEIHITPFESNWIGAYKDVVLYCPAIDLVRAYEDFGYQLFEPNVRAHINKSKVNAAIEESVKRRSSRHEFRLLNNGVTITCAGYSKPKENRGHFIVREPGIVNGLQTVVALHSGYQQLSHTDKVDFEENCFVLARILQKDAVADIGKVVLATNNQNPMQTRNLVSNRSEQIFYEQLFAEKGWFYERKQGSWDAFYADPTQWRTLQNKRPKHFRSPTLKGRPRYKRIDNEELAQVWLSFIGFSREAANLKKELFDDKWYEFIFLQQIPNHASNYDYKLEQAQSQSITKAPDTDLMLLAWLARELEKSVAPSAKKNRDKAIQRLNLDPVSMPKENIDVKLADDFKYTIGQVLRGSSLLFVELLGYVLYRAIGNPHNKGALILSNGISKQLKTSFDLESVTSLIENNDFEQNDVLAVIWSAFYYILENLLLGPWKDSYRAAPVKSRFLSSIETRSRFVNEFERLDEFLMKRELPRVWATGITKGDGFYKFIAKNILE